MQKNISQLFGEYATSLETGRWIVTGMISIKTGMCKFLYNPKNAGKMYIHNSMEVMCLLEKCGNENSKMSFAFKTLR